MDADFFEEGGKIVLKKMDSFGQSHNISDGRLENLACTYDLKRLKEKSISIHLFIFNSDTFACVGLEKTFQQSAPD